MRVIVDDFPMEIEEGCLLGDLLRSMGEDARGIVVEVNGAYVHPGEWDGVVLRPGDRVEVIYPAYGG